MTLYFCSSLSNLRNPTAVFFTGTETKGKGTTKKSGDTRNTIGMFQVPGIPSLLRKLSNHSTISAAAFCATSSA